jgi:hypothetical protein
MNAGLMTLPDNGEIILESHRAGHFLKVTAVHVASGLEAVAVGPVHEPKAVERLAIAKLKRLLATG